MNSYPVTALKYGLYQYGPKFFQGAKPDLVVTGPNLGSNIGLLNLFSGTSGAATYAVTNASIPAISFSGGDITKNAWNHSTQSSSIYGELGTKLTNKLISAGKPYLPNNTFLNVNFPPLNNATCPTADSFSFILTRINAPVPSTPPDIEICDASRRLPNEFDVVLKGTIGCFVSVSVGYADTKMDATINEQTQVYQKLDGLLTCPTF